MPTPKLHTRENMSEELRRELELIEDHEQLLIVKANIEEAKEAGLFYLVSTYGPSKHNQSANPFEIRAFWDEPGLQELLKVDFRQEMLEKLEGYGLDEAREYYAAAAKAMRDFADELDALAKNAS